MVKSMKTVNKYIIFLVLTFLISVTTNSVFSQTKKDPGNMYTMWVKLALVGKNQTEIEYYFKNIDEKTIGLIKKRIRFAVIDNLKRSGLHSLIRNSSDSDDLNVIVKKIITEIRYVGLEHDQDLRLSIKEEFGVRLDDI
jgi:hypothetical protein